MCAAHRYVENRRVKQALDKWGFDAPLAVPVGTKKITRQGTGIFIPYRPTPLNPRHSAPNCGRFIMHAKPKAKACGCSPFQTGPNWISGNTSIWKASKSYPLFLGPAPNGERDGLILMVDDDRFPLRDGETPVMRSIRFRTLGCYPLTGAVNQTRKHCPK